MWKLERCHLTTYFFCIWFIKFLISRHLKNNKVENFLGTFIWHVKRHICVKHWPITIKYVMKIVLPFFIWFEPQYSYLTGLSAKPFFKSCLSIFFLSTTPSVPNYKMFRLLQVGLHTEQNEWINILKSVSIHPNKKKS